MEIAKKQKDIRLILQFCNIKYLHGNTDVVRLALQTLTDVTNHKREVRDPSESDLLQPLLHLLRFAPDEHVKGQVVDVLWNISNDRERKLQLMQSADALLPEVFSLMTGACEPLQWCATGLIGSLTLAPNVDGESSTATRLLNAGVLPPLVHVLRTSSVRAKTEAAGAIWNLAYEISHQEEIYDSDVVPLLIALLRSERSNSEARRCAAGALCNLTDSVQNVGRSVREGIIPPMIEALKCGTAAVKEQAAIAVRNIAAVAECRRDLDNAGVCEALLSVLKASDRDEARGTVWRMKAAAVRAIDELANSDTIATNFKSMGAESILKKYRDGLGQSWDVKIASALTKIFYAS